MRMSKYTHGEIEQIIDDLDFAKAFLPDGEEAAGTDFPQARRSMMNASDILSQLPIEVIETLDKTRDVFEPPPARKKA
jgi:hypothetical protein